VAGDLRAAGWDVSASHEVSPEPREYERTVTTVVNAFLRPVCRPYLRGLADAAVEVTVMTSGGGLVDLETAGELPVALLLSGPAAGVRAAAAVAVACGHPDALTFDMGGTSTDVCLVLGGEPELASGHRVAGLPVRTPAVDVHTIGAGGGSIAGLDPGGALVVGPRSAGAVPGPACYGRGGSEPTVTDADLVAGRIPDGATLGELGTLDRAASERALAAGGVDAEGVIAVVDANMEQALRAVSVERGVDPAGLALVAFGGAGPLHACALADALGMPTVIVPAAAGVLSAVGLLTSPRRREVVRSRVEPADHAGLADEAAELSSAALAALGAVGDPAAAVEVAYDCRYAGQSHELRVPTVDAFPAEHVRRNGVDRPGDPIEVTAVRAVGTLPPPATIEEVLGAWEGRWTDPVVGPVAVAREDCTIWVADGWVGEPGPLGSLVLHRSGGPGPGRRPPDLTAPGFAALSGGRNGPPSGDRPPPPGDRTSGRVAERRGPEESLR
jgi:N-methylhydantoinase A/oxoprolinase/acetone carboxylase beta subunit